MGNIFSDDSSKNSTTQYLVGVGTGLLVLFATVWVVGKAWKKSQKSA
jgi:hypothetical protein